MMYDGRLCSGKWIEILFNKKYQIKGAKIYNYLLEKSRIVHQVCVCVCDVCDV